MNDMSSVGQGEQNGRLNPRQIATKLIAVEGGAPVRILDASDEQFDLFIKQVGIKVKQGEEGEKWSFDNRCRVINFALKCGAPLLFANENSSEIEQKQLENNSDAAQNEMTELASEGDVTNAKE